MGAEDASEIKAQGRQRAIRVRLPAIVMFLNFTRPLLDEYEDVSPVTTRDPHLVVEVGRRQYLREETLRRWRGGRRDSAR